MIGGNPPLESPFHKVAVLGQKLFEWIQRNSKRMTKTEISDTTKLDVLQYDARTITDEDSNDNNRWFYGLKSNAI